MKLNYGRILGAGLVFGIIAQVIHTVAATFEMSYYMQSAYFCLWSSLMMPHAGPPGMQFFMYAILFSIISGIIFAWTYAIVNKSIPDKGAYKGLWFGVLLFFAVAFTGTLSMYLLLAIPTALLMLWALENFIIFLIGGVAISKIYK